MTIPEVIEHWEHKLKNDKNSMWERGVILETVRQLKKGQMKQSRFCRACGEKVE